MKINQKNAAPIKCIPLLQEIFSNRWKCIVDYLRNLKYSAATEPLIYTDNKPLTFKVTMNYFSFFKLLFAWSYN